jgi:hypothetical protein
MFKMIAIAALSIGFAAAGTSIPEGATEVEPGVYKHTDAKGKTFVFRKTPFGVVKSAEEPAKPAAKAADKSVGEKAKSTASPFGKVNAAPPANHVRVTERGDELEFERASPFGPYKWKRNKNDLNEAEREAWDKARGQNAAATKPTAGPKE